ncbi:MAG: TetR/AcrR family transcriptional regulator [Actinomycetota bacterium]
MARPPKYSSDQILDAVVEVVKRKGVAAVSATGVAALLGAPSGSIYHRFPSRDVLVASAWLRAGERFRGELAGALAGPDPEAAALTAVRGTLDWARRRPSEASFFLAYGKADLTKNEWPPEVFRRANRLGNDLTDTLRRFSARLPGTSLARLRFALIDVPQAALRRALTNGSAIDSEVQTLVEETVMALLGRSEPVSRMAS